MKWTFGLYENPLMKLAQRRDSKSGSLPGVEYHIRLMRIFLKPHGAVIAGGFSSFARPVCVASPQMVPP